MLSGMADTKMTKLAGEHWVCSVMAQHNWAVALTRDGLERADVLAVHSISRAMVEVQVKTSSARPEANWPLGLKAQEPARSEHEWFVLVVLGDSPAIGTRAYVVPRDHLSAATWISHQDWLTAPRVKPGTRNAGLHQARVRESVFAEYLDRWDLLEHPTPGVPVLLPTSYRKLARDPRVRLPPRHPWVKKLPSW